MFSRDTSQFESETDDKTKMISNRISLLFQFKVIINITYVALYAQIQKQRYYYQIKVLVQLLGIDYRVNIDS